MAIAVGPKIAEPHEEPHAAIFGDKVIQYEEVHEAAEAAEQGEEVGVARKRVSKWAPLAQVVAADALDCQIKPVSYVPPE